MDKQPCRTVEFCYGFGMTAFEEARSMVERLSVPERQALIDWISAETVEVAPSIFRTPGVCGGDACIRGMRLPVWQLEESRRGGATDAQILEMHPQLSREDLARAWKYVETHRAEIEHAIQENENV
jgi:uncharacterized protein (DUF433 family)